MGSSKTHHVYIICSFTGPLEGVLLKRFQKWPSDQFEDHFDAAQRGNEPHSFNLLHIDEETLGDCCYGDPSIVSSPGTPSSPSSGPK